MMQITGFSALELQDHAEAVRCFSRVVALDPDVSHMVFALRTVSFVLAQ